MFVFVFLLVAVSGSYAGKIKNCSNCNKKKLIKLSDIYICDKATVGYPKRWRVKRFKDTYHDKKLLDDSYTYVIEAKKRGLSCGVKNSSKTIIASNENIAGSIWTFYENDGDVRLFLFNKDNTFKFKNVKSYYHMGKVFGDDDERWSITDNIVLISHNGGYNKIYLNINDTRDVMRGVARNKKGKVQKVIGILEKKEVIFKNGYFFKYKKPSKEKIAEYVAETKNIKIKYAEISKTKILPDTSNNIKTYTKNFTNKNKEIDKEKQKFINLQRKADAKEQRLIEEKSKRKALEKRIAELEKKNKELQQPKKIKQKSSNEIGSGFYVSKFRHVVTNQHVVNQCKKITVGDSMSTQIPSDLIALDKRNDLAILQTVSMEMASAETKSFIQNLSIEIVPIISGGLMRSEDIKGGEEIVVAGYPLGNMVSDTIKVTKGIVSATRGMDNNFSQFEIDAVIRKGNSGGPIYDKRGNIVGVAVSRLNVNRTDTINFGIKGSIVKQFLSANDIPTTWANRAQRIDTQDLYKIASKQTVMVVCYR